MMEQCLFYVSKTKQNVRRANHILSPSINVPSFSSLSLYLPLLLWAGRECAATGHINQRE